MRPWAQRHSLRHQQMLEALEQHYHFSMRTPFKDLPQEIQQAMLYGSKGEPVSFFYEQGGRRYYAPRPFPGVIPLLQERYRETDSPVVREEIEQYMGVRPCPDCGGARLRREALAVKLDGANISEVTGFTVAGALRWFVSLDLTPRQAEIARRILKEITERLGFLEEVGLDYLTLDRATGTLAGGEAQRIRLATQIGSKLSGVLYILDEPSIGLHPRDTQKLLHTLKTLRDLGNTVIVVEHDPETILQADYVVDMGPGAGREGGLVVFAGTPAQLRRHEAVANRPVSLGPAADPPAPLPPASPRIFLRLKGPRATISKDLDLDIPLGVFTLRHRGLRLRQVHPDHGHPVPGPAPEALRGQDRRGAV